jgi:hypothetical protein
MPEVRSKLVDALRLDLPQGMVSGESPHPSASRQTPSPPACAEASAGRAEGKGLWSNQDTAATSASP